MHVQESLMPRENLQSIELWTLDLWGCLALGHWQQIILGALRIGLF